MIHDLTAKGPRLDPAAHCLTLDAGVQSFLDRVLEAELLPYAPGLDPAARRAIATRLQADAPPVEEPIVHLTVPGAEAISLRLCRPMRGMARPVPVVFYLHGGLWALGGWDTHGGAAAALARSCGAALVFVDHGGLPAAQALRQARAALDWTRAQGRDHGLDTARMAVAGDGSGGAMAALLAATLPPSEGFRLLLLFHPLVGPAAPDTPSSPWLDHCDLPSLMAQAFPGQPSWTGLSPLDLSSDRLRRLPSTLILTAEADLAREGGEALARRLMRAEVDASALRLMGTIHDFFWLDGLADTTPTLSALAVAQRALTDAFGR
ncbi:alpha/beta hydrolase [Nitrospirillum viridazoti]|nr:alpha/beta hydrolase [Nitrospirillum amazonense]TWB43066.1 acetyl esterase [Nitrospirillum amazonense]